MLTFFAIKYYSMYWHKYFHKLVYIVFLTPNNCAMGWGQGQKQWGSVGMGRKVVRCISLRHYQYKVGVIWREWVTLGGHFVMAHSSITVKLNIWILEGLIVHVILEYWQHNCFCFGTMHAHRRNDLIKFSTETNIIFTSAPDVLRMLMHSAEFRTGSNCVFCVCVYTVSHKKSSFQLHKNVQINEETGELYDRKWSGTFSMANYHFCEHA